MKNTNRGANGKNGSKWIRPERRLAIYHRDGFACVWCGRNDKLSLDHVVARSSGGTNESRNIVTSCLPCNSARQVGGRRWLQKLRANGVDTATIGRRVRALRRRQIDLDAGRRALAVRRGVSL